MMVGLHRVGVVGLRKALEQADASGLGSRDDIVDLMMELLAVDNYIPDRQKDEYRLALWREFLRYRGEEFRDFFSQVAVTVRGEPGAERDRLVKAAEHAFASFELKPVFLFEPPEEGGPRFELLIGQHSVVQGSPSGEHLKSAVRKSLSHW
jgi:hypothetical protein